MAKTQNIVQTSPATAKIDALVEEYSTLIVDSVSAGMPLSQTLIYFKKNSPLNTALWAQIEQRVTRNLQVFQPTKIHLNGSIGAPEILAQNGSKLELRGFKPSFQKLEDYSHLIAKSEGTKQFVGDKPLKTALDIIRQYSIDYGYQVKALAEYLKAETPIQSAFNVWYFIKKNIKYEFDTPGQEELRTPARTWADRMNPGVDCDDYAIFAAALLIQMGYKPQFRVVQFNNKPGYGHIYVVLDNVVIDACLNRWNEHPQNITKSMKIYTLKGVDNEVIVVDNASDLGDAAQITQGAFGAVATIGSAIPPPIGTVMGVLGGIGSAIASLFRGKPEIKPEDYEKTFNALVAKANELAGLVNENSPAPVINSSRQAILQLSKDLDAGTEKLKKDYSIPVEFLLNIRQKIQAPLDKFNQISKIQGERFDRNLKALLISASLYAKGDKSQAQNIATIWRAMYAYAPNIVPQNFFGDGIENYDPTKQQVEGGKIGRGTNAITSNLQSTKEMYAIMQKAQSELLSQPSGGTTTTPTTTPGETIPGTTTTPGSMLQTAGMGTGLKWTLAVATAFAGYKLLIHN